MAISWNVVNQTGEAFDFVSAKVRGKIVKLEKLLVHFPEGSVHLQIVVGSNSHRKQYVVTLNLRIPSDILHAEKTSESLTSAVDKSLRALVREVQKKKDMYHQSRHPHRKEASAGKADAAETVFAYEPLPAGRKPEHLQDMVLDLLKHRYEPLVQFIARRLGEYVAAGTITTGAVDPRDVVDHVAEVALRHPGLKAKEFDYPRWFTALAFHETRKAVHRHFKEHSQSIPLDEKVTQRGRYELAEAREDDQTPWDQMDEGIEPTEATAREFIPAPGSEAPDVAVEEVEMLETLRKTIRTWPAIQKEIFDMYFIEGFSREHIAAAFRCDADIIDRHIRGIQDRLRKRLLEISLAGGSREVSPAEREAFAERASRHLAAV